LSKPQLLPYGSTPITVQFPCGLMFEATPVLDFFIHYCVMCKRSSHSVVRYNLMVTCLKNWSLSLWGNCSLCDVTELTQLVGKSIFACNNISKHTEEMSE